MQISRPSKVSILPEGIRKNVLGYQTAPRSQRLPIMSSQGLKASGMG